MLKKRDEYVEYGFDAFSEDQQKAVTELKASIEKILGQPFIRHLEAIEKALIARDKIKNISPSFEKAISLGGVFVSLETIYIMLVISCSFCIEKDESIKVDNILALIEEELDKLHEMKKEERHNDKY